MTTEQLCVGECSAAAAVEMTMMMMQDLPPAALELLCTVGVQSEEPQYLPSVEGNVGPVRLVKAFCGTWKSHLILVRIPRSTSHSAVPCMSSQVKLFEKTVEVNQMILGSCLSVREHGSMADPGAFDTRQACSSAREHVSHGVHVVLLQVNASSLEGTMFLQSRCEPHCSWWLALNMLL